MSGLPVIPGREFVRALPKLGYEIDRRHGSHIILKHPAAPDRRLVAPDHHEIAKGTLRAIVRPAGTSIDNLKRCFKS